MVLSVELLKTSSVDMILELSDSKVLDFNGVGDCPLETDGNGR
jgi:hypothetical protein